MQRREFIASAVGFLGSVVPSIVRAQSKPCPPDRVQVAGGTAVSTICGSEPVGETYLAQQASTMSPGQWKQVTTGGLSTSLFVDGPNNTLDYLDKGAYDPIRKQIRFIGQSHYGDQRFHQYDESSNTWSNLPDPPWDGGGAAYPGFLGHGYQHNTIDPATGDLYYRQYNYPRPRRHNRGSGAWSELPSAGAMDIAGALEWLPTIGSQGGLVFHVGTNVRFWNKANNTWATGSTSLSGAGGYHNAAVLNRVTNEVYFGGGNGSSKVWKIDGSGTVNAVASCPVSYGINSTITTACPKSGAMLVIDSNGSAFHFSGSTWAAMSMTGAPNFGSVNSGSKIVAVPIEAYGVVLFLFGGSSAVWLYRHA